jgi:hypothetical protein
MAKNQNHTYERRRYADSGILQAGELVTDYDKHTGDGKWLELSLAILREAISETEAVPVPEPQKSMREESVELASGAANHNQQCGANPLQ